MPSVTRSKRATRSERRIANRQSLMAATERLLADAPYTAISVEQIIREAGISRSTFYTYFEDKAELLSALAEDIISELMTAAQAWWSLPPNATRDDLFGAMRSITETFLPHQHVWLALAETASYDPGTGARHRALIGKTVERVAEHIADGQRNNYVRRELDAEPVAAWLTAMTERGLMQIVAPAAPEQVDRLVASLTDIVWNVLYVRTRHMPVVR